ncbi:MAG: hypothetical protein WCS72_13440 [Deltaproteobacteria bacterium]
MSYLLIAFGSAAVGYALAVVTLSSRARDQADVYRDEQAELDAQRREIRNLRRLGKSQ